jgi:hypothetical protein
MKKGRVSADFSKRVDSLCTYSYYDKEEGIDRILFCTSECTEMNTKRFDKQNVSVSAPISNPPKL